MGSFFALTGRFQRIKVGAGRTKVWGASNIIFYIKKIVISKGLHFKAVSDFPILAPKS